MNDQFRKPLLFKTVEELQNRIDEYFDYCDNKTKEVHSEKLGDMIVPDPQPYGMAALAYHMGIDRKTLINYSKREPYFLTVKRARDRVEADIERRMNTKDTFTPGLIFNAKVNFGYRDQIDITSDGEKIDQGNTIVFTDFKDDTKR